MPEHDSDLTPPGADSPEHEAAEPSARAELEPAAWVSAAGVSGEHLLAGERAPRWHWALMILGPVGLAIAIAASLWSSGRQVQRSVNVQVETTWAAGEQLAVRTQLLDGERKPVDPGAAVSLAVLAGEERHELAALDPVAPGFAQGRFEVPALAPGEAELLIQFEPGPGTGIEPFEERLPITVVAERQAAAGRQVVSEHMLQWADDTDEQPEGARIDLRPAGRLLASFDNTMFVRVTDPAGKPWAPKAAGAPAMVQVLLISGEWAGKIGRSENPPIVYEGPLDPLGLASFSGVLDSEVVRFEVRLIGEAEAAARANPAPPAPASPPQPAPPQPAPPQGDPPQPTPAPGKPALYTGPKRGLRFVSHAGTVRLQASTDLARPGEPVVIGVEAISARRPVYVDVHDPSGAWIDSFTPPLQVPQAREWSIPGAFIEASKAGTIVQFEGYQTTLRPEDSSALARVQVVAFDSGPAEWIAALIERQRAQLDLPRVDKQFEIGRERAYLSFIEQRLTGPDAAALDEATVARARAFLLGSLEAVVYGPPQALNTRAREEQTLAEFKLRWRDRVRWLLFGGGGLFIVVLATLLWRNQRALEIQTTQALGFAPGAKGAPLADDAEVFADQSLMLQRSRRELLARGVFSIVLAVAALALTVAMLEAFVWSYG